MILRHVVPALTLSLVVSYLFLILINVYHGLTLLNVQPEYYNINQETFFQQHLFSKHGSCDLCCIMIWILESKINKKQQQNVCPCKHFGPAPLFLCFRMLLNHMQVLMSKGLSFPSEFFHGAFRVYQKNVVTVTAEDNVKMRRK